MLLYFKLVYLVNRYSKINREKYDGNLLSRMWLCISFQVGIYFVKEPQKRGKNFKLQMCISYDSWPRQISN